MNSVLKIAQISTPNKTENPGGLERYVTSINNARSEASNTKFISTSDLAPNSHWLNRSMLIALHLFRNIRRFDVVESHFILTGFISSILIPKPIVIFFHSPWAEERYIGGSQNGFLYLLRKRIEKIYLQRAHSIITVGKSMREYLLIEHDIAPSKICVVGAGVDTNIFCFNPSINPEFIVFAARRIEKRMGILELIHAWDMSTLKKTGKLRIAGTGSQLAEANHLVKELELSDSVFLLGRVPEEVLVAEYQNAAVSIIPTSALEGFGLVCLESFSCGTPVISTRIGELKFLVGEKWPELTYESGKPKELAKILDFISANRQELPTRHEVYDYSTKFTWDSTVRKISDVYTKISINRFSV